MKVPKRYRCVVEEPLGERCPWRAARVVSFESTTKPGTLRVCNWHAGFLERLGLDEGPVPEGHGFYAPTEPAGGRIP